MRLLLDTHTFIWWDSDPSQLSDKAYSLCADESNELSLSVASVWEMQIKHELGKLDLDLPLQQMVNEQRTGNDIGLFDVRVEHVYGLYELPHIHKDPFDRMLVAQARQDELRLVTKDPRIQEYPVDWVWW
jgi:PIN domain nuclease of toxin-antitoxin system